MKLLYATSATYPSTFANRLQIAAMAKAFSTALATDFSLGLFSGTGLPPEIRVIPMGTHVRSYVLAWRYLMLIRRERFTHVFIREERLLFFLGIYVRLSRTPVQLVLESHWIRPGFRFRMAVRLAHRVIAISGGLKEDLVAKFHVSPEKILVAHDAVDIGQFGGNKTHTRTQFPIDKKVIVYSGSFGHHHPWKGVDVLADSAQYAPANWLYFFVGGKPEEVAALRAARPSPQLQFEAYRPNTEIPAILQEADVLVLPNKKGNELSERYTSPLKLFEYMASGTPIVASDLPSTREVLSEDSATFFEPNDPKALATALEEVFADYPRACEKARRARTQAESCTWTTRAERILAFIGSGG